MNENTNKPKVVWEIIHLSNNESFLIISSQLLVWMNTKPKLHPRFPLIAPIFLKLLKDFIHQSPNGNRGCGYTASRFAHMSDEPEIFNRSLMWKP